MRPPVVPGGWPPRVRAARGRGKARPVTASVPSGFTRVIPGRWASSAVGFTPTLPISCANTVFTEWTVADRSVIAPPPSPSTLCTVQDEPGVGRQWGYVYALGAE